MKYMAVLALIGLDLVTGWTGAIMNKKFESSKMRIGLFHKAAQIMEICFGFLVDYFARYLCLNIPFSIEICVIAYISFMECGSILENLSKIDERIVPEKVRVLFKDKREE